MDTLASDGTEKEEVPDGMRNTGSGNTMLFRSSMIEYRLLRFLWWQMIHINPSNWKLSYGLETCINLLPHFPRVLTYLYLLIIFIIFTAFFISLHCGRYIDSKLNSW